MPIRQKVERFEAVVDGYGPYVFTKELPVGAELLGGELVRCVGFVRVYVDALVVTDAETEPRKLLVMERDDDGIDVTDHMRGNFECQLRVHEHDDTYATAYLFEIYEDEEPSNG